VTPAMHARDDLRYHNPIPVSCYPTPFREKPFFTGGGGGVCNIRVLSTADLTSFAKHNTKPTKPQKLARSLVLRVPVGFAYVLYLLH
jgi:hypothetical protein